VTTGLPARGMAELDVGRAGPSALDPATRDALEGISSATISTVLLKQGLRNAWIRKARPIDGGFPRIAGRAFTLRFVPAREDLSTPESLGSHRSTRVAVESMPEGCIAVVDAMGIIDAGILGDIICQRMRMRGVAALVTDGAVRDLEGVRETGLPVWCNGAAAPPSVAGLLFVDWNTPIGCGGVAVFPDDVIVVDGDGAVVIPAAMLDEVVRAAADQEMLDSWVMREVKAGRALPGLYPPDPATRAEYEAWRAGEARKP
jgi:regulator of RNase E activity RraA